MRNGVLAAPTCDMGMTVVDQPLDTPLTVVWQHQLTGFHNLVARFDLVAGIPVVTSHERGVLTVRATPPDLQSIVDLWPVPVRVAGSAYPGQIMLIDDSGTVYRLTPGREPVPVWQTTPSPDDIGLVGLPNGQLLDSKFDGESWSETTLIDEATGKVVWRSRVLLAPAILVGDQLLGGAGTLGHDLTSLDLHTGQERWRRPNALRSASQVVAVVGGVLWAIDSFRGQLLGFAVDSGHPVSTVELPHSPRSSVLDQAGRMHLADEHGWLVVDLTQAQVSADIRFEECGMKEVYADRTLRAADGRLVLADHRGQLFVVHPARPQRPELVARCPEIKGIGITEGRLIVLSYDGTLTAIGAPS